MEPRPGSRTPDVEEAPELGAILVGCEQAEVRVDGIGFAAARPRRTDERPPLADAQAKELGVATGGAARKSGQDDRVELPAFG